MDDLTRQAVIEAVRTPAGTIPRPERLCTEAARDPEVIAWTWGRSLR